MPSLVPSWPLAHSQCTVEPLSGKKPRSGNQPKPGNASNAVPVNQTASICKKGCPLHNWTIDQYCKVCHAPSDRIDQGDGTSGPCGAQMALGANDQCSSYAGSHPLSSLYNKKVLVPGCVRGNGLCPLVGWTIHSYCQHCIIKGCMMQFSF